MKESLIEIFLKSSGVCTDSRKAYPGCLFFALRGPSFNGNEYIVHAKQKGAIAAVCDDPVYATDFCFLVDDCLSALQALATDYRRRLNIPILALTGSNGKTTTKELIGLVMQKRFKVSMTHGNLNNHIGVPLTILAIPSDATFAIIEMGANHQKEIAQLAQIAQPTFGLITNIGSAHIEGFGSKVGIAKGKFELFDFLIARSLPILYRSNAYKLEEMVGNYSVAHRIDDDGFVIRGYSYRIEVLKLNPFISFYVFGPNKTVHFKSQLFGKHNLENIIMAIYCGLYFEIELSDIALAIMDYIPSNNRSQIVQWKGAKVYLDAYNANPDSMKMALESFCKSTEKPRLIILGEMKELGEQSQFEHRELLTQIEKLDVDEIHLFGTEWSKLQLQLHCTYHTDFDHLRSNITKKELDGYSILIKGSRSNQLERLITE